MDCWRREGDGPQGLAQGLHACEGCWPGEPSMIGVGVCEILWFYEHLHGVLTQCLALARFIYDCEKNLGKVDSMVFEVFLRKKRIVSLGWGIAVRESVLQEGARHPNMIDSQAAFPSAWLPHPGTQSGRDLASSLEELSFISAPQLPGAQFCSGSK